ncbi:MAG: 50S ribosomal protein L25 [Chloroflexota bacterium]
MEHIHLQSSKRDVLGKGVKLLRRQGITPAHVFGHGLDSLALQIETTRLEHSLAQSGETRLINLKVDKEKTERPVLVREIQRDALTRKLIHVDFYQVKMEEKVEVEVPIVVVGETPALKSKDIMLLRELSSLAVECLPANIPARLEVNISSLAKVGQAIRIKDIAIDPAVTILGDPEQSVVRLIARAEEKEEVVAEAAPEAEAAAPEEAKPTEEKPKPE